MNVSTKFFTLSAALAALSISSVTAQTIVTPSGATSASGNLSSRPIEEAINGNGLSSGGTSGDILSETHGINSDNDGEYFIANLSGAQLDFTLSGPSTVDTLHLWTYARIGENDRGMSSFDISFSTDNGSNFGSTISISGIAEGDNSNPIPVQNFGFTSQDNVTDIRFTNIVNHGDGSFYGISEVRFSAVPEPSALSLIGLVGALGLVRRRR